jgi:hypothetical protein
MLIAVAVVLVACGGALTVTHRNMLEWGPTLNAFMATNMDNANSYPDSLDEIDPMMREDLKDVDGWGNKILYRKLRIDKYNLISAGPDGEFGNDDDVVVENGALYPASEVYARSPFKK